MTVEIPLTRGYVALVDAEDAPRVSALSWHAKIERCGSVYAATTLPGGRYIRMHDYLVSAPKGKTVDHRNRDTLDNRRSTNLRVATHSQQAANRRGWSSVGYKGVRRERSGRYTARIRVAGNLCHIGTFDKPEQAARAYDRAARESFGEFACTNFPAMRDACDLALSRGE